MQCSSVRIIVMDENAGLTIGEIAGMLGLNISTPRAWVNSGRLAAHRDPTNPRRWLVDGNDLNAFLENAPRTDIGRPKGRGLAVEPTGREDWSDAPEQATLDLATSLQLPRGVR